MQELKIAKWVLYTCIFIAVTYHAAIAQHHNSIPIEYELSAAIKKVECQDSMCLIPNAHHKTLARFKSGKVDTFHNECYYSFDSRENDFLEKIIKYRKKPPYSYFIEKNDGIADSFNVDGEVRPVSKIIDSPFKQ